MKKLPKKSLIIDRLHKGFVLCCVAATIFGTAHLGYRWYRYATVLRPEQKRRELLQQQELLAEGAPDLAPELKL